MFKGTNFAEIIHFYLGQKNNFSILIVSSDLIFKGTIFDKIIIFF